MRTATLLISILLYFSASNAIASDARIMWFSSDTSNLLNRSSYELTTNQIKRGVHFAEQALQTPLSLEDEWIAHYNLCMAYNLSSSEFSSNAHCEYIGERNQGLLFITTVRGTLRIKRIHSTIDLVQVVNLNTINN